MSTHHPVVAHIKDHFLPLSETFIYTLLRAHRRYRPIVLGRHSRVYADHFPWDAYYSPAQAFGAWAGVLERACLRLCGRSPYLEHVLSRTRARVLHVHFGQVAVLFVPLARRLGLPLITSFYGKDVSVFARQASWRERFRSLWRYGDVCFALGPAMAGQLVALGCPEERVHVLPLAVDVERIPFSRREPPARGEPVRLLTVGRLIPKKGVDVLLQALAQIAPSVRVHLWVIGDGPQRRALEELAHSLGVTEHVTFLGWKPHPEVLTWMQRAHVFVLASRDDPLTGETEGTPTVLLEAQASGLPVVSTRHADIPFIVEDGRSGVLVPEGDVQALAQALESVCAHPEQWSAMGQAGRSLVESRHDVKRIIVRLETVYDSTIKARTQLRT